jgi:tetratricopeptide (TPR) repeat protein/predicted Ser/Thr protein kinase
MGSSDGSGCLSDDTLALFLEGELGGAEQQQAEAHLASCNHCLEILAAAGAAGHPPEEGLGVPSASTGRYQVGGVLGHGGMGVVFHGLDSETGQRIAIKRIRSDIADAPEFIERFEREAEILRRLAHPNIVRLLALEVSGGHRQIVMEYVSGGSLRELLSAGPVPLRRTLALAVELSDALARAHHLNVIHRDLKPENILLAEDGSPRLSDFGLARLTQGAFTQTGIVVGTIAYQCPEVLSGQPADARSDVWAFGVVLFELLSGRRLFEGSQPGALIAAILQAPLPDLAAHCPEAPPRLLTLLQRMLERAPARRIASMRQIGAELESIAGGKEPRALAGQGSAAPARTPLVGRESELERLERWLSDAAAGRGKVILISGEAGSGKTALCAELLERVRRAQPGWRLASGHCVEHFGRGEAYAPFLQAVGSLLDHDSDGQISAALQLHAPAWCLQFPARFSSPELLAHLHRITLGAPGERMLRELGDMLGALARSAPIVLRLEDFHWADPASVDLLAALARRAPELRLLLLVTLRPDALERGDGSAAWLRRDLIARELGEELAVAPLGAADVQAYLEREYQPNDFAPELSEFVLRKTEGLALFATRLVRYLAEQQVIVRTSAGFQLSVPPQQIALEVPESMRALIRSKLASLSEGDREALCCASVEGEEFTSAVLARLLGSDVLALEERLRALASIHRLVVQLGEELLPSGELTLRYRFAHVLYRDVLYADLAPRRQRALHLSVAETLVAQHAGQAQDSAARIAAHFERGADPRRAIDHWLIAADNEVRAYAFRDAAATLSHALELVLALPAHERPRRSAELRRKRAWALFRLDLVREAMAELELVRALALELGDRELECGVLNALSHLAIFTHRAGEMEQLATEALALAEAIGHEGMALVARAHLAGGRLWAEPGTEQALAPIIERARALRYEPALTIALALQGVVHYFRGKYELCLPELEECLRYTVEVRQPQFVITVIRTIGSAHAHLGRIDAARKSFAEALDLARRNGFATPQLHSENDLYWLRRELGGAAGAEASAESGIRPSLELPADANSPASRGILGTLYPLFEAEVNVVLCARREQRRAPSPVAETAYGLAELWTTRVPWWHWAQRLRLSAYRAQRALCAGELGTAHEQALGALELALHYGSVKLQALIRRILAEVAVERGELEAASSLLEQALAGLVEFPIPLIAWKLEASLGRVAQLRNQPDAARAAFERAVRGIEAIAGQIGDPTERAQFLKASHLELDGDASRSDVSSSSGRP